MGHGISTAFGLGTLAGFFMDRGIALSKNSFASEDPDCLTYVGVRRASARISSASSCSGKSTQGILWLWHCIVRGHPSGDINGMV